MRFAEKREITQTVIKNGLQWCEKQKGSIKGLQVLNKIGLSSSWGFAVFIKGL